MSSRATLLAVSAALALASCGAPLPQTPASRSSAAAVASCRASTEAAFNRQNRYLLSERDQTDTPFSTSGLPGVTTRGLTQRYDYDNDLQNCLAASNASSAAATPVAPEPRSMTTP